MKKLILFCFMVLLVSNISAIKINEIEMNPPGTDTGNEWVELYNKEEINLEGYKLINNDGDEIILSGSFSGYYVYVFDKQWLDNSDEKIFLYKNNELIDETDLFTDSGNDIKTWQLCDGWEFLEATKGEKNKCETKDEEESEKEKEIIEENQEIKEEPEPEELKVVSSGSITPEVIKLEPLETKDIKSEDDKKVLDKSQYVKYGFVVFCILLGFLFILKNRRKQKNELV